MNIFDNNNIPSEFYFDIKGTYFDINRSLNSKKISNADILNYTREYHNIYDPFAISINHNENMIGYVPKEYSRIISTEIDLNQKKYEVNIIKIKPGKEYNKIYIRMYEK